MDLAQESSSSDMRLRDALKSSALPVRCASLARAHHGSWGLVATAMISSARRCSSTSRALRSAWLKPVSSRALLLRFQWFPPELRARSISRFYVAWPLSVVVMGALSGALMGLDGRHGLAAGNGSSLCKAFPPLFSASYSSWLCLTTRHGSMADRAGTGCHPRPHPRPKRPEFP